MDQKSVITVNDFTRVNFESRRPGCEKGLIHAEEPVQTAVFRVAPGSGVPGHLHSRVYDLFIGVKGVLEIRYEGQHAQGIFRLKPGAFCAVPPGVRHEVFNPSDTEDAFFLSVHAPHHSYDFVPVNFQHVQPALSDQEYAAEERYKGEKKTTARSQTF